METVKSYFQMTKPAIALLVVTTTVPAVLLAAGSLPGLLWILPAVLVGTYLASCSAAMFNHLADADLDATMTRTSRRPVPAGRINRNVAFALATILAALSFALLYFLASPLAAWVALAGNFFYAVIYTLILKRTTTQNIVIGGAAGAVGPLIGWAAVTGELGWPAWALFLIIFLWTPPHFWALAIKYKEDYARAGIPMLPVVRGNEFTGRQMLYYTLGLIPVVLVIYTGGEAGLVYLIPAVAMTGWFCWLALRLVRSKNVIHAMPVFYFSLLYIFGIFGALTLDRLITLL